MRINDCDPSFKHEVAAQPGGAGIKACFGCAACSARCPVGDNRPEYDPRRLIRKVLLGRREEVLSSPLIWLCSACYTCQEVCPQQVRFTDVMTAIRNLACRAGHEPAGARVTRELLAQRGRLLMVGDFENEKRADLGLPAVSELPEDYQAILGCAPTEGEDTRQGEEGR